MLHPILQRKKLVLLDFDGTLVDSMGMWESLDRRLLQMHGIEIPDGLSERLIPLNEDETAAVFLELGCPGTVKSIREFHDRMAQEEYEKSIPLKRGAKELLDELRSANVKLGIVSASTLARMLPCLSRLGLTGYFHIILPCGEYAVNKSTSEPYQMALKNLGISAEDAVFIDDFYGNINGARAAGITTVGVYDSIGAPTWGQMQQCADLCIESLDQLILREDNQ
ncbi:MAG: HAD family phosphatase [Clostridia bacterium]|nr:HAD family phosphatase [Clostridia bacterium]